LRLYYILYSKCIYLHMSYLNINSKYPDIEMSSIKLTFIIRTFGHCSISTLNVSLDGLVILPFCLRLDSGLESVDRPPDRRMTGYRHIRIGNHHHGHSYRTATLLRAKSLDTSAGASGLLYKEEEKLLVQFGILEDELMKNNCSQLEANELLSWFHVLFVLFQYILGNE
jgi:hypothetical protein